MTDFGAWLGAQANSYILKPITAKGVGGFVFDIRDDERVELRSEITDYVMEDNSVAQDHISTKAPVITLRGFIGELKRVRTAPIPITAALQNKLAEISTYLPIRSNGTSLIVGSGGDVIDKINNAADRAQNLVSLVARSPFGTAQQNAFSALKAMWQTRQIFTVETPWEYFDNMAIQQVVFEQDSKTEMYSDIIITLKQLKFATVKVEAPISSGRTKDMMSAEVSKLVKGEAIDPLSTPWSSAVKGLQSAALSSILGDGGGNN